MSTQSALNVPGLTAGTWIIDPVHSEVGFVARHLMVSKVRGKFTQFEGTITIGENPLDSKAEVSIDAASIYTGDETRDAHLRSPDFLDVEQYPKLTFVSRTVEPAGDRYAVTGDLTIKDVTREVVLDVEFNGAGPGMQPNETRAGFSATTEINRKDFGLTWNMAVEGGGLIVGDKVQITLEVEAIKQS
jgi:polyisoprenoid-binding protein YceI